MRFVFGVAVSVIAAIVAGALLWRRPNPRSQFICEHCHDNGAVVIIAAKPRLNFCNFCVLGRTYDRAANPPVDWAGVVRRAGHIEQEPRGEQ